VAPLSPSQDTVGILTADALDCWRVVRVLRGDRSPIFDGPVTVAVPGELWQDQVTDDVAASFARACQLLASSGYLVVGCQLPSAAMAPAISYLVLLAEAARQWPAPERPGSLSDHVANELAAGRRVTPAEYGGARKLAADIRDELLRMLSRDAQVLALPTTAAAAVTPDDTVVARGSTTETVASAYCRFTALASITGLPAISVPGPVSRSGLPVGIQLIAAPGAEPVLCRLAARFQATCHAVSALHLSGADLRKSLVPEVEDVHRG
jgi:aspartyl-tRNA(Asn)/glutamyl-tRNA(Gln) amidotransferase subunit A